MYPRSASGHSAGTVGPGPGGFPLPADPGPERRREWQRGCHGQRVPDDVGADHPPELLVAEFGAIEGDGQLADHRVLRLEPGDFPLHPGNPRRRPKHGIVEDSEKADAGEDRDTGHRAEAQGPDARSAASETASSRLAG